MTWLRQVRHWWCLLLHGVTLNNYRRVYRRDVEGMECRWCGIFTS